MSVRDLQRLLDRSAIHRTVGPRSDRVERDFLTLVARSSREADGASTTDGATVGLRVGYHLFPSRATTVGATVEGTSEVGGR